jgi:hypothetical protein
LLLPLLVLKSGEPELPFCLCWANGTWTGIWHGAPDRVLIEQTYPGSDDHRRHFQLLSEAFQDRRYITVDGKPIFLIYRPSEIPEVRRVTDLWREMADKSGLTGLYLIGFSWDPNWIPQEHGFDASLTERLPKLRRWGSWHKPFRWLITRYQVRTGRPAIYPYRKILPDLLGDGTSNGRAYPCVIPNWDNTPRSERNGLVLNESTPELFRIHLKEALQIVQDFPPEQRIIFVKSWNEWAEGNHLEPDLRFGRGYLQVIKDEILG